MKLGSSSFAAAEFGVAQMENRLSVFEDAP